MRGSDDSQETAAKRDKAEAIVQTLVEAGYPSYFAGGTVRDMLLGGPPADIDIATAAPPETIASLFPKTIPVGAEFGVILVIEEGEPFEVATFRAEGPYPDGRRPAWVKPADARTDVARRDFTINGLLFDPLQDEIIDWVEGRKDIERRLIRSIGDPGERFSEDKLRMLRAVRLAANLGFRIEEHTGAAIRERATEIQVVSGERIRKELVGIFTGPHPAEGLGLLERYGLLSPLLPEVSAMKGVEQGKDYHPEGDVFAHTLKILSLLSRPTVSLAFAALLHDVGKPPTWNPGGRPLFPDHARVGAEMSQEILKRLRFDRRTRERIVKSVANHLRFLDVRRMREATLRRFMASHNFDEELELHRLDCLAGSGDLSNWEFVVQKRKELELEPLPAPPLLRGRDLLRLGFAPGPKMGEILEEVEEKRLEGALRSAEEAERWVKENYRP
jgi:tRNA nucleotidyltransferase/poly(A) polymerase